MPTVKRWFLITEQGEVLDGPFRKRKHAESERAQHLKLYRYEPRIAEEDVELEPETLEPESVD